jgi:hypothetical protein
MRCIVRIGVLASLRFRSYLVPSTAVAIQAAAPASDASRYSVPSLNLRACKGITITSYQLLA